MNNSLKPVMVKLEEKIIKIGAGYNTTFAITENNELIAWGQNSEGQLGLGNYDNRLLPTKVINMKNVLDIKAGRTYAIAITTDGTVWTVGNNSFGSLTGTEYRRNTFKPVEAISNSVQENGNTTNLENIAYISAGEYHNLALTTNRKLYVWGYNVYGQLGLGNTDTIDTPTQITGISGIMEISAGRSKSNIVTREGDIYITGLNNLGQFGNGTRENKTEFTLINTISDVYSAVSGNTYTMAISKEGTVWAWGDYYHGIGDIRTTSNSDIPVQIGNNSFYLKEDDIAINKNNSKQIQINSASRFNVYENETSYNNYTFTSLNEDVATVDENGNVRGIKVGTTWVKITENTTHQEQVAIIRVIEEQNIVAPKIVGGQNYAAILKADGGIWNFGYNSNGELGNAGFTSSNIPKEINVLKTYKDIKAGGNFTLILRNDGMVWSVGDNQFGQLGLGNRTSIQKPEVIQGLTNIAKISAGTKHSVALTKYGEVYTWGNNERGQLGVKSTDTMDTPTKISIPGVRIIDVSAGNNYTALVDANGNVYISGDIAGISSQEFTLLNGDSNIVKVSAGDNLIALTKLGDVLKIDETVTTIYDAKNAIDIAAKNGNYMIQNNNGELYVFGKNTYGELGLGIVDTNINTPQKVENTQTVISIGAGTNNTYYIADTGRVYSAGLNKYGALGNGNDINSNKHILVGTQEFIVEPDNVLISINDIISFEIASERYNVLKQDLRTLEDFTFTSEDTNIITIEENTKIKGISEGETKLKITQKDTGKEQEVIVVVEPLDAQRIDKITVNETQAKVSGTKKYEVTIVTNEETAELVVTTKDATDKISIIEEGNTSLGDQEWFEGELRTTISLTTPITEIPIKVKTANETEFEYTLKVIKQSSNADLEHLYINEVEATAISATKYVAVIEEDLANIHAITMNNNATVSIDSEKAEIHETAIDISMGENLTRTVPIKVTAEGGNEIDYLLTIYKKSALTDLESLKVDGVEAIQNTYSPSKYSIMIERDVTEVEINAISLYNLAKVDINHLGADIHETTKTVKITEDETIVRINVVAEGEEKEHILTINRKPDTSGLAFLYVNGEKVEQTKENIYETYIATNAKEAEVLAIAAVNTSIVQIGINPSEIGQSTVTVATKELENTYVITVTDSENLENTQSYTLIIKKPSKNNQLKEVVIQNSEMQVTAKRITGTNNYTAKINQKYTNMTVIGIADYEFSEVAIDTNSYSVGQDTLDITFDGQNYTLPIKVKAQDGTEEEYTLILERLSNNTNLLEVKVDGNQAILNETLTDTYEITLSRKIEEVEVNIKAENEFTEIAINNIVFELAQITKQITMDARDITLKIYVKAEDGTQKTYNLIIHSLPDNAKLKEITVNGIKAEAEQYTNTYKIRLPKALKEYNVTAVAQDELATVEFLELEGNTPSIGTKTENILKQGNPTRLNIKITAQDPDATENYTLEITEMSSDAKLSYVKVDGAFIEISEDGQYHIKVQNTKEEVNVEALANDLLATVGIDEVGANNLVTKPLALTGEVTVFDIIVTAEDGTTQSYKLNIEKMSSNTELLSVYVDGKLIENVDGKYTTKVGNVEAVLVEATTVHEKANISIDRNQEVLHQNSETINITKEEEERAIEIIVTAEDGTIKTYELILQTLSSDATLLEITAEGVNEERIVQISETEYQITVSEELETLNLTAITNKQVAKVKIENNEYELNTTTKSVSIPEETNTILITVQAEDGTEKQYTITIIKKIELTLKSITVNGEIAEEGDGGYIAWIGAEDTQAQLVITPTSSKANITVDGFGTTTGTKTLTVRTEDENTEVKIIVKSPVNEEVSEYTLTLVKKSNDTGLAYVEVDKQNGLLEEDNFTYTVEVPIKEEPYEMKVATLNPYASVKIEGKEEFSLETDTIMVDLEGQESKTIQITVKAQDGTIKNYNVIIKQMSADTSIKELKVNNTTIIEENGQYKAFIPVELTEVPLYIETTHEQAKIKLDNVEEENIHTITTDVKMEKDVVDIEIRITAQNNEIKTYTLSILKESSDTEIQEVKVDGKAAILKEEDTYYINSTPGVEEVEINVVASNQYASVQINDSEKTIRENTIKFTLPTNTKIVEVPIIITAQNGKDAKTYKLQIEQISNNTDIAKIQVNDVDVTQYDEETKTYTMIVENSIEEAKVYVETENEMSSVKIDVGILNKHTSTETVNTLNDENIFTITVVAEDGTSQTRQLVIKKLSKDASILKLLVNGKEIEAQSDGTYKTDILENITEALVRIQATNKNAQIEINNILQQTKGEAEETIDTTTGKQIIIPIKITAEDGTTVKETTLTINKVSENKDLEYVKVNNEQAVEYDEENYTYKVFIPTDTTEASLEIKTISPYASINIEGNTSKNIATYTKNIESDITYVYISVIAEDNSTRTYTIILEKKATDNTLKQLLKDGIEVEAQEDGNYIINVAEETTQIVLKAIANSEYATVQIAANSQDINQSEKTIQLGAQKTTQVNIVVTSQNGEERTYTVTINKISASTELEYVKVNSNDITIYDEITKTYTAFIPKDSTSVSLDIKTKNEYATITCGETSGKQLIGITPTIENEETLLEVTVIAESGISETYYIKLVKESSDNTIKEIYVDGTLIQINEEGKYIAQVLETNTQAIVKVIATNKYANITINEFEAQIAETQREITLNNERTTEVTITVVSQTGETLQETLIIKKVTAETGIDKVLVNKTECDEYDEATKTYTKYIDEDVDISTVLVTAKSNHSTVVLNAQTQLGSVETQVDTSNEVTKLDITITAETGTIEKYYLNIMKKSKDTSLEIVKINDIIIEEPYETGIKQLDAKVKVYIKTTNNKATLQIADEEEELSESTITLRIDLSQNTIILPVIVTAQNGEKETHNITLMRKSNNAEIKEILVNDEIVDLEKLEHIVKNVNISNIKVTTQDTNAKVSIDNNAPILNIATSSVDTTLTTVRTITVTAEDGTIKQYTLTLTKKITINGNISDANIMNQHIAIIVVYQTSDTRQEMNIKDIMANIKLETDGTITLNKDIINAQQREIINIIKTNEDGTYEIALEPGIYDTLFIKPGYLSHRITEIDITQGIGAQLNTVELLGGDVIQTGKIEIDDMVDLSDNIGVSITNENKSEKSIYDLNGDGIIDILDRNIVKANFGKREEIEKWVKPTTRKKKKEESLEDEKWTGSGDGERDEESKNYVITTRISPLISYTLPISGDYKISSNYGYRIHPITGERKLHAGIDLVGTHHTEILSIAEGTVTFAGIQKGYGNCIEIKHEINGITIYSFYAHLSRLDVEVGQKVKEGKVIGLEGGAPTDLGHGTSTGHHLHFEIRNASGGGHSVDPNEYINFEN